MPSSSSASPAVALRRPGASRTRGHPGVALVIMLSAQLMIILDMTVVNIALPHIQAGLHFSAAGLSWVLNAYTLTFGGLLLLGGRAGDILGRRRMFLAGIALFTVSSLAGGLATTAWWLLTARALQGVGGALASPAVLALVVGSFPEGRERTRALGIYSAVAMGGASLGLVLGGVITEWASWRWVLFINVPVGIAVIAITPLFITESPRQPGRFDVTGAVTSIAGMTALVYAFIRAASDGWSDRLTLAAFAVAAVMLAAFLLTESRARQPITPLRLFTSPARAGSYLARLLLVAGMFGMFFFLTQFVQDILGFSPLAAGFAFLPMTLTVFAVSRAAPRLLPRFGPTRLMVAGMLPVIGGMAWLAQVSTQTTYLGRRPGPDAAHRHRDGHRVRPAHDGVAGRGGARGLRRGLQHGERHPAGRRLAGAGHPGHRVRLRLPERGPAPGPGGEPGERRPPAARARHVRGLHGRRHLRRVRPAGHPG